ncbi:hypothetical protein LI328DRAFT_133663 [Trichoderma asperelloides]|nr:hypothetical protein LI328DRAFT_133663 [Trichoderma asperelloides]
MQESRKQRARQQKPLLFPVAPKRGACARVGMVGIASGAVLFVPRDHRHWMTRRCNGRTARAATVCAAWMGWRMGWMDWLQLPLHRGAVTPISTTGSRSRRGKGAPTAENGTHRVDHSEKEGRTDDDKRERLRMHRGNCSLLRC